MASLGWRITLLRSKATLHPTDIFLILACSSPVSFLRQINFPSRLGNKHFAAKEYEKAVELYSEAIRLDSKNHVYYSNRRLVSCRFDSVIDCEEEYKLYCNNELT